MVTTMKIDPLIKAKTSIYLDAMATRSLREERQDKLGKLGDVFTAEQKLIISIGANDDLVELKQKESQALLNLLEYCYNPETRPPCKSEGHITLTPETWWRIFNPPKKDTDK